MFYPRQLKLEMRQRQLIDIYGNNVIYAGPNPYSLLQSPGTLTNPWVDFTDFVQGLDKLQLSWSTTQTPEGEVAEGQFVPKKGSSDTLTFERDAQQFLKSILIDDVAAPLNQVEVRITDISIAQFTGYAVKSTDLSWCEFNSLCTYDINIKQQDEYTQCIERTMIADNWQGMFSNQPTMEVAPGILKKHPRFSYCVEKRPNGTMVVEWYLIGILSIMMVPLLWGVALGFNSLAFAINGLIASINTVIDAFNSLTGGSVSHISPISYIDPTDIQTSWVQIYIESAGCGREHPAPLIRDYISNVCDKCGIRYDATTVDIFFAPIITIQTSDGLTYNKPNPHYNACLFFPVAKRGIRRYKDLKLLGPSPKDTTTYYEQLNQPVWALSDMLDHVKKVYNAQWRIMADAAGTPYLHFHRKDWFQNQAPIYNFGIGGVDRKKLLEGICYQPTEFTAPASMNGLYQDDPADKCGHEASMQQNGEPVSFNNTINNPLFHGVLNKQSGFGSAKFRLDGSSTDYIYDAMQVLCNGSWISMGLTLIGMSAVSDFVERYCDYALLLQNETVTLPKILLWDGKETTESGNPYLNARCLRDSMIIAGTEYFIGKSAVPGTVPGVGMPDINPKYPTQVSPATVIPVPTLIAPATVPALLPWDDVLKYAPHTHVLGESMSPATAPAGTYLVSTSFGIAIIGPSAAILVNYPCYFNPFFKDGLFDWFHWIDDPYNFPRLHKNWSLKIPLCKEDVEKLEARDDGYKIKLLDTILLDTQYYNHGVITSINLSWDTTDNGSGPVIGQYIELKGEV